MTADLPAYCFYRVFEPEPPKTLQMDRHYLLYASEGTLRLTAQGRSWALYPGRAAWLAAGEPVEVRIDAPLTSCSVLYRPDTIDAPPGPVTVFDMSRLARELALGARVWGPDLTELPEIAVTHFKLLGLTALALARNPSNAWIPVGQSDGLRRALTATEARFADPGLTIQAVAAEAGLSERTLGRRCRQELAMTWRQALRRIRILHAIETLTRSDVSTLEVGYRCGYASSSAFTAAFQEHTGTTPAAYRAALRAPAPKAGAGSY
ncbi:MAG: AraC family transcriptional regulator [Pseudomonadota bacterium]